MKRCLVLSVAILMAVPAASWGRERKQSAPVCVAVPINVPSATVQVSGQKIRLGGRSNPEICLTADQSVVVIPAVTRHEGCGQVCVSVRVTKLDASVNLRATLTWWEGGQQKSQEFDPEPVGVTEDLADTCFSLHGDGFSDPCEQ